MSETTEPPLLALDPATADRLAREMPRAFLAALRKEHPATAEELAVVRLQRHLTTFQAAVYAATTILPRLRALKGN